MRQLLLLLLLFFSGLAAAELVEKHTFKPNIIIIYVDDLGCGDLGCYGSTLHRTPNIDRMAADGVRFTSFYSAAPVGTPARAALLTGCYAQRVDMHIDSKREAVFAPVSDKGLNPDETTVAEMLKRLGYRTALIGKWHLGDQRRFMPLNHGFDYFFGIPYSHNMVYRKRRPYRPPLPLVENDSVIEAPLEVADLTGLFAEKALEFIRVNRKRRFFLYLAHPMVQVPLSSGKRFARRSNNGPYGDAVEEIDYWVGEIIGALHKYALDRRTLIIFSSDNGACKYIHGSSALTSHSNKPFSGWKGETLEGGMRVPMIMRWKGVIPPGKETSELASIMDILPTIAAITAAKLPKNKIDGKNIFPLMTETGAKSPTKVFYYYLRDQLQCVRKGRWKLHLSLRKKYRHRGRSSAKDTPLKLYDLDNDPAEQFNVASGHPEIVAELMFYADHARKTLGDWRRPGSEMRPAGKVKYPVPIVRY